MSAIAFYDSGRLLPYRHDLKQKQIEQRNIDAENTRKYIGYAGGAFANMAERTGTIFGARLGSTPQAKDPTTGAMVDAPQKYGGGTVGAEYAKADWQKGVMDDENHRRKVTHKLGLLTENVKYASLIRKRQAWGDFDPVAGEAHYEKRWKQYLADVTAGAKSKTELMRTYKDLFSENDYITMEKINALDEGEDKDARLKTLDKFIPFSRWLKYAEENKYYDPTVAGKPRPEVDLLMAYLKDEVKFPGMEQMIADKDNKKSSEEVINKRKAKEENLAEQVLAKRKITEGKYKKAHPEQFQEDEEESSSWLQDWMKTSPETFKMYPGLGNFKSNLMEQKKPAKPIVPTSMPKDFDFNVLADTPKNQKSLIEYDGTRSLAKIMDTIPTLNVGGEELTVTDKFINTFGRYKDAIMYKIHHDIPFFEESKEPIWFGNTQIYKPVTKEEKINAGNVLNEKLKNFKDQEILKLGDESGGERNLLESIYNETKAIIETYLLDDKQLYKGQTVGGLEHIRKQVGALNAGVPWEERVKVKSPASASITMPNVKTNIVSPSTTYEIDPASLNRDERKAQAINYVIDHEDPDLTGRVIDDNARAILGGSVDAWEIVDGDIEKGRHVIMDVLKIKDQEKMRAFVQYFNTKDLDEYLGHIKKDKKTGKVIKDQPALTDQQMKRRRLLKLTPEQTKALVTWAYDNNLRTLTNNHGFLNQAVYENNPSLHQFLGDMAYRHGGSFMTSPTAGYTGLADALNHALNPTKKFSREDAIAKMDRLIFGQGTYGDNNKKISNRYHFLKDRFQRFKANTDGINVVAYKGKGGADVTLVDSNSKLKNFNPLYNPDLVNPNSLVLPKFTLTGIGK